MNNYHPIIIIGAARSGTKLLRDTSAQHPQIDVIPYDINYIWRLKNEHVKHDALKVHDLDTDKIQSIRREFDKFSNGSPFLVEKTVSNCLRIPFIEQVLDSPTYVHLVRDGRDVVESVARQWTAKPDWKYILRKGLTFPLLKAPQYATRYIRDILQRQMNPESAETVTWGPRYPGIDTDIRHLSLLEVCAIQWATCLELALDALEDIPNERYITVRYEDFVNAPQITLRAVCDIVGLDYADYPANALASVERGNIGKGLKALSNEQIETIMPHLRTGLARLGYS